MTVLESRPYLDVMRNDSCICIGLNEFVYLNNHKCCNQMRQDTFKWYFFFLVCFLLVSSCEKNSFVVDENGYISADVYSMVEEGIMKTVQEYGTSDVLVDKLKRVDGVSAVSLKDDLIWIETEFGLPFVVSFYDSSYQTPIQESDRIDTCGIAAQAFWENYANSVIDNTSEGVFDVPLEVLEVDDNDNEDYEDFETKASYSIFKRTILSRRKMAVWCPWSFFSDEKHFTNAMEENGLMYDILTDYSPSGFSCFANYDLVYVASHGLPGGYLIVPSSVAGKYLEPFLITVADGSRRVDTYRLERSGIITDICVELPNGRVDKTIALGEAFFDSHLPNLSKTIIWTSACHLGSNNSAFLRSCFKKGCPEYYGADNVSQCEGPMSTFKEFLVHFTQGSSSLASYRKGLNTFNRIPRKYRFLRYPNNGERNVTYVVPRITGLKKTSIRSADLGVEYDYSLEIPGTVDLSTLNSMGIRLYNAAGQPERDVYMSSQNTLNRSSENINNLLLAGKATVKIEGLVPGNKYRYRSFVKIGNRLWLSNQYQVFSTNWLSGYYYTSGDLFSGPRVIPFRFLTTTQVTDWISSDYQYVVFYATRIDGDTITCLMTDVENNATIRFTGKMNADGTVIHFTFVNVDGEPCQCTLEYRGDFNTNPSAFS